MNEFFSIGSKGTVHLFGIKLVGFNSENLGKFLITIGFIIAAVAVAWVLRVIARKFSTGHNRKRIAFWIRQAINLGTFFAVILGIASIWFDDPARLTTAMGLITAGLAFALQKVVTSLAGYFVILRGKTFNVGDRIVMGGVRGDVVSLGFMQTTIMEMGQPPSVQAADPAMWVRSRQFTGRLVTVPNSKIFDDPVYNYSRDFELLWEEFTLPIAYRDDRDQAEAILLTAATEQQTKLQELPAERMRELCRRFDVLDIRDLEPKVYYRITDNWLELTVRFISHVRGVRDVKDSMARRILPQLEQAKIGIASATFEITGMPRVDLRMRAPLDETRQKQPEDF